MILFWEGFYNILPKIVLCLGRKMMEGVVDGWTALDCSNIAFLLTTHVPSYGGWVIMNVSDILAMGFCGTKTSPSFLPGCDCEVLDVGLSRIARRS